MYTIWISRAASALFESLPGLTKTRDCCLPGSGLYHFDNCTDKTFIINRSRYAIKASEHPVRKISHQIDTRPATYHLYPSPDPRTDQPIHHSNMQYLLARSSRDPPFRHLAQRALVLDEHAHDPTDAHRNYNRDQALCDSLGVSLNDGRSEHLR